MCGIFGMIIKEPNPSMIGKFFNGFAHLQHRGQESAGVAYSDGNNVWTHKGMGLIQSVFGEDNEKKEDTVTRIINRKPLMIVGQTRYSTSGEKSSRDMPPPWLEILEGRVALVHNGNIPNPKNEFERLKKSGVWFNSDNDSELILKKILQRARNYDEPFNLMYGIKKFMQDTIGAYSAAVLCSAGIYIFRDPKAFRPLSYIENDSYFMFASETCALAGMGEPIKDVQPNSIMWRPLFNGPHNSKDVLNPVSESCKSHCVFEKIYFARPDSRTFSRETEGIFRLRLGMKLAQQYPVPDADFITGMPDSGRFASEGYAFQIKKPLLSAYVRDRYYMTRNFINPLKERRSDLKYHLMEEFIGSKYDFIPGDNMVLVDDSIVRGDTLRNRVEELKKAGAKEVHIRISSPKLISPCYYGIDIPTRSEIIGSTRTVEEIREYLGADSLRYLDEIFVREVLDEFGSDPNQYCMACFNGIYPTKIEV